MELYCRTGPPQRWNLSVGNSYFLMLTRELLSICFPDPVYTCHMESDGTYYDGPISLNIKSNFLPSLYYNINDLNLKASRSNI